MPRELTDFEYEEILRKKSAQTEHARHKELTGNLAPLTKIAELLDNNNKVIALLAGELRNSANQSDLKELVKVMETLIKQSNENTAKILIAISHKPSKIVLKRDGNGNLYAEPVWVKK